MNKSAYIDKDFDPGLDQVLLNTSKNIDFDPNTCINFYREEKICWIDTNGKKCKGICVNYHNVYKEGF